MQGLKKRVIKSWGERLSYFKENILKGSVNVIVFLHLKHICVHCILRFGSWVGEHFQPLRFSVTEPCWYFCILVRLGGNIWHRHMPLVSKRSMGSLKRGRKIKPVTYEVWSYQTSINIVKVSPKGLKFTYILVSIYIHSRLLFLLL